MGGGDLNLKKSWHPLTMKNLERVWKVEQHDEAEKKRIAELQSEIREERNREEMQQMAVDSGFSKARDERVEWLYRGPGAVNREDYLLGKKIDKSIDPTLIEAEREQEALASGPGALFVPPDALNTATDLEAKIREDPLFMIKKKEEEAKRHILNNPVKMKQLQELLTKDKKKKKHKSKKKHRHRHSDSEEEDTISDSKRAREKSPKRFRDEERDRSPHRRRRSLSPDNGGGRGHNRVSRRDVSPREERKKRDRSPLERKGRSSDRPLSRVPAVYRRTQNYSRKVANGGSQLSQEEKERRRQEMMQSAKQRDIEREEKVTKHKKVLEKEEAEIKYDKEEFLKPLKMQSITSSQSLEDRIHRHINSVQRTRVALDDNFMAR